MSGYNDYLNAAGYEMIEHTFTKEEVSKLHNAKCTLYHGIKHLEAVLNPHIIDRFQLALNDLDEIMKPVYVREEELRKKANEMLDAFRAQHAGKLKYSVWSMDEADMTKKLYPLGVGYISGLVYEGKISALPSDPTYGDFWLAAEDLIRQCTLEDDGWNHIFIEGFRLFTNKEGQWLELQTGS